MTTGWRAVLVAGLVAGFVSGPAQPLAAQTPVVVELFTSQGCASCPPADANLAELAARDDVIALALHVDYWDYLGWKDPFAHAGFTERQKSYARAVGSKMIYTPQVIVAGTARVPGFKTAEIASLIRQHAAAAGTVQLELLREGNALRIRATAEPPLDRAVQIVLVRYRPAETVTIERGENAGRTETYHNIVTAWNAIAQWAGDAPIRVDAVADGPDPVVVIVQEPGPGPIIAAARLR
ncbi:MAG: DUF1223 domain-containing protein [Gemmobacter sp.]